jgi:Flp pilus assembly pilin Flp
VKGITSNLIQTAKKPNLGQAVALLQRAIETIGPSANLLWNEEDAQDMVEYSLLLGFIALASVGLLSGIKLKISGIFSTAQSLLTAGAS